MEVLTLIAGLPETSRYAGRIAGESRYSGWSVQDWLALDMRNALEGLRATVVAIASGKTKDTFRKWDSYPGQDVQRANRHQNRLKTLTSMATPVTQ